MGGGNRVLGDYEQDVVLDRVEAFVLDCLVACVVAVGVGIGLAVLIEGRMVISISVGVAFVGYFVVFEGRYGQTLGKRLVGVVVVRRDGDPITFEQAVVRNLCHAVDGLFMYAVGIFVMLTNEDRRRVGDIAAETKVVHADDASA